MKERVGQMVGQIVEGMPWLGTFHSIGVKILRRHTRNDRPQARFTILDVDDQVRLLKQLLAAENIDEKRLAGAGAREPDRQLGRTAVFTRNRYLRAKRASFGGAAVS